eukprot:Selendium_serpulae@DN5182_c0_g1_i1.p1
MQGSRPWDELRGELRQLERSISARVAELCRAHQSLEEVRTQNAEDRLTLEAQFDEASQIHDDVNEGLSSASHLLSTLGSSSVTSTQVAQFRRFKDIFSSLKRDSDVAWHALDKQFKRASLLPGATPTKIGNDDSHLLRERNALDSSLEILNSTIAQGSRTHTSMRTQHSGLRGISVKMSGIGSQLPSTNELIAKIRRAKLRDQIVLAAVTGTCIFAILLYFFYL